MKKIFTITLFFFIYILNSTIAKADLNSIIPKSDLKSLTPVSEKSMLTSEFEDPNFSLQKAEGALSAYFYLQQFYSCWEIPPNLPNSNNLIVR